MELLWNMEHQQHDIKVEIHAGDKKLNLLSNEPMELKLKKLPDFLEYTFLAEDSKFSVNISSILSVDHKVKLVEVLKQHKKAITWKIADIKGINPSFCTDKILMEENLKPIV